MRAKPQLFEPSTDCWLPKYKYSLVAICGLCSSISLNNQKAKVTYRYFKQQAAKGLNSTAWWESKGWTRMTCPPSHCHSCSIGTASTTYSKKLPLCCKRQPPRLLKYTPHFFLKTYKSDCFLFCILTLPLPDSWNKTCADLPWFP